jgi:hypothetical protein
MALGCKGDVIKKYVVDCCSLNSNLTVNLKTGDVEILRPGRGRSTARFSFLSRACSTTLRATIRSGKSTVGTAGEGWTTDGLPAHILLAMYGYAAGQAIVGGAVAEWRCALEGLGTTMSPQPALA